ncbi:MAG: hypothetical protein QW470_07555 [Candidatus Caldarchaeum sp.]
MSVREENLNVMLAELLAEKGLKALGEVVLKKPGRRLEPDVYLLINGVRIVIEGKRPGMWDELEQKCRERLDNNVCDICVMVEYLDWTDSGPPITSLNPTQMQIRQALLNGKFRMGVMTYVERVGLERWLEERPKKALEVYENIGFHELVTYIMAAYDRMVREDVIAPVVERMDRVLRDFAANIVRTIDVARLMEVLELREKGGEEEE